MGDEYGMRRGALEGYWERWRLVVRLHGETVHGLWLVNIQYHSVIWSGSLIEGNSSPFLPASSLLRFLGCGNCAGDFDTAAVAPSIIMQMLRPMPTPWLPIRLLRSRPLRRGYEAPKQKMLHNRQLSQHLFHKHPPQTLFHLLPVLRPRYIIQHRLRPFKPLYAFGRHCVPHHVQIHILISLLF